MSWAKLRQLYRGLNVLSYRQIKVFFGFKIENN